MQRRFACLYLALLGFPSFLQAGDLYVATNGASVAPYTNWVNAATNIQTAVDYALPGDTITVGDGVYSAYVSTNKYLITISNNITLKSLNGPNAAILDVKAGTVSADRHSLWLKTTATNALVSGFTLQGTYFNNTGTDNKPVRLEAGTISNCVVRNNKVTGGVGGVGMSGGRLVDCVISNNICTEWQNGRGGGIFMTGGLVDKCLIQGNESQTYFGGGGVYQTAGVLRNCLILKNRALYFLISRDPATHIGKGAGVRLTAGRVENCTISGNTALDKGAGLYMTGGAVSNNIIYYNNSPERHAAVERDLYVGGGVARYNCAPLASGTGDVAADPQFADRTADNYTLLPGSPCIDAGAALSFTDDKNSTPRPIGTAWDIGAYEAPLSTADPFTCNFTAPQTEAINSLTVDFTAFVAGANTTIAGYKWQFGDGAESEGPALQTVSHTYTTGWHTVTLTVSNTSAEVASRTKTAYIKVNPTILYVEKTGSHTPPYDTPTRAATNIETAVQAAVAGATVIIGDGIWAMAEQVEVEKAIRVRSANGPANCTSTVPGQVRSFYMWHTNAVIEGLTLTTSGQGDHAMSGAGVFMLQGLVTNCVFKNIVIGGQGGGVWLAGGTVSDCVIVSNRAYEHQYSYGAGLFIANYAVYGPALVENCLIASNLCESYLGGGGVYMYRGTIRNCLIAGNRCTISNATEKGIGGGIRMAGGLMENCTVVSNFSISSGGGAYVTGASAVTNSIIYFNTVVIAPAGERNLYSSGGAFGYSCIDPAPGGTANTALDPKFENADTLDFHLKAESPCVDQGLNKDWMTSAVDLDGLLRKQNNVVDMGCYETPDPSSGPLISGFSASPAEGFVNAEVVFAAEPVGLDINITNYWWTFGDGNTAEGPDKATVTNTYSAGYYDVTLIMVNQSGQFATNTKTAFIKVAPQTAYVSTNGSAVAPYLSWETAASTIQDALAVVGRSGENHTIVAVSNGVYTFVSQIALATNYTIRGVGDAVSNVVIQGVGSRLFLITSPGATLEGLTLKGGVMYGPYDYGAGLYMTAGLVSNCVIRDCTTLGLGGGLYLDGGTVTHCTFYTNASTEWQTGGGGGAYVKSGIIQNCIFDRNRTTSWVGGGGVYLDGGELRNSLFLKNTADCYRTDVPQGTESDGGGVKVAGGRMENCTVADNWAEDSGGGINCSGGSVTNCIVFYNTAAGLGTTPFKQDIAGTTTAIGYSCSPDLTAGTNGNITADPTFVSTNDANYRLERLSPCIEKGVALPWTTPDAVDLDGRARLQGKRPDMGAYEADAPRVGVLLFLL